MAAPLSAIITAGPDLGTPNPLLADKWDPNTRDYASLDEGMDPTDAHVLHELYVVRRSGACVLDVGMEPPPATMLDSLEQEFASAVRLALARLLAAGDIQLVKVKLTINDQSNQLAEGTVTYVNLRTGQRRSVPFPLSAAPVEV